MKRTVEVVFVVDVEMDEAKFTPEFMAEFYKHFFHIDTLDEHAGHIAQLAVREVLDERFTEGYGPLKDMGIEAKVHMFDKPRIIEIAE
ncbi:hypothetical protein [Methylocystis sp. S23]